ncbi:MAG: hypothetical protein HC901_03825 [Bdellovibrionaceae bacterium]|nr:hypothetical protein [Pseudobdellovibrionaceae bacterium]
MIRMLKQKFSGLLIVMLLLLAAPPFFFTDQMPRRDAHGNAQLLTIGGKNYTIKDFQSVMRDTAVLLTIQTGQLLRDNRNCNRCCRSWPSNAWCSTTRPAVAGSMPISTRSPVS